MIAHDAIPLPLRHEDTLRLLSPDDPRPRFSEVPGMPEVDAAGATDVGLVRERNEDQFAIAELHRWARVRSSSLTFGRGERWSGGAQALLLAVADGMGGHGGGDMASSVALDAFMHYVSYAMPWYSALRRGQEAALGEDLAAAVGASEARLASVTTQRRMNELLPGTTLTAAYLVWPQLFVLHVGDSRCYVVREGEPWRLTTDHTLAEKLVEKDAMSREEADGSPLSNVLWKAVGGGQRDVVPQVIHLDLRERDAVLLCTDGLTGHVVDAAIARLISGADSAAEACASLIEAAKRGGGRDNVTAVVARF